MGKTAGNILQDSVADVEIRATPCACGADAYWNCDSTSSCFDG